MTLVKERTNGSRERTQRARKQTHPEAVNPSLTNGQRQLSRENIIFQQMVLEQPDIHRQKKCVCVWGGDLDTNLTPMTKLYSKWILDITTANSKLEDNRGKNLGDLGPNQDVLDTTPKAQSMKGLIS